MLTFHKELDEILHFELKCVELNGFEIKFK